MRHAKINNQLWLVYSLDGDQTIREVNTILQTNDVMLFIQPVTGRYP